MELSGPVQGAAVERLISKGRQRPSSAIKERVGEAVLVLAAFLSFGLSYLVFIWGLSQQVGAYPEAIGWAVVAVITLPCIPVSVVTAVEALTGWN